VLVDGRTVTIPSYLVRTGELITPGETAARMPTVQGEPAGDAAIQDLGARVWRILLGRVRARLRRGLLSAVGSTAASAQTRRSLRRMAAVHRAP
jgi:predicted kinase